VESSLVRTSAGASRGRVQFGVQRHTAIRESGIRGKQADAKATEDHRREARERALLERLELLIGGRGGTQRQDLPLDEARRRGRRAALPHQVHPRAAQAKGAPAAGGKHAPVRRGKHVGAVLLCETALMSHKTRIVHIRTLPLKFEDAYDQLDFRRPTMPR
jgi:hypothetical protein